MISKSPKETAQIAKHFLAKILKQIDKQKGATIVGLSGNLGAGKTAFTQAVAKYLGVKSKVVSPTFVIMKKYPLPLPRGSAQRARGSKLKYLFHLDAYRLKNEKELLHLGWDEVKNNKEHLVFIEWPENVSKIIPKSAHYIKISHHKKIGHRNFKFE